MSLLTFATALFVGCLLIVSGLQKVRAGDVIESAANFDVLPLSIVQVAAPALPWIEVLVGAALITGTFMPVALTAAAILMAVFSAGILVNLLRGRQIDCGVELVAGPSPGHCSLKT